MVISEKYKYVYLDNPKTATVSTVKILLENDSSARNRVFSIQGHDVGFEDHTRAVILKNKLGNNYDQYKSFSFIRNPLSKIVSAYFFYKNGNPVNEGFRTPLSTRFKIIFARTLPFSLWALLYPYRSNLYHLADVNGQIIVKYIGLYERLEKDLRDILNDIGVHFYLPALPHENKSTHNSYDHYFKNPLFKIILRMKLKRDLEFYNFIASHKKFYKIKPLEIIKF